MKLRIGKIFMKFNPATVIMRNSFLGLLRINLLRLAHAMYKAGLNNRSTPFYAKVKRWWERLGGNFTKLMNAFKRGIQVEWKHHPADHVGTKAVFSYNGGYDSIAPAVAAPAVAATPLIIQILNFLKAAGVNPVKLAQDIKGLVQKGGADLIKGRKIQTVNGQRVVIVPGDAVNRMISEEDGKNPSDHSKYQTWIALAGLGVAVATLYIYSRNAKK